MPTSLFHQNYKSFFKFTHFKPEEIVILRGTKKQRRKQMADPNGKVFIASFNFFAPSGTWDNPGPSEYDALREHHKIGALFVDEWHMGFKSLTSKRTQGLLFSLQWIPIFVPMTGTAVDGHLDSVYPLIHAIEPRYYLNYQDFLNQHCVYDFYGKKTGQWKNVQKVKEILARHCVRHTFEEVHGADETIIEPRGCDMDPHHQELYDDYESTGLMMTHSEGLKEAAHGAEMVLRLRQLCNCPEIFAEGDFCQPGVKKVHLTKDEMIETDIESALQANKKVLIFAVFKAEQDRLVKICEAAGARVALLNGTVAQGKPREAIEHGFRNGEFDIVVASAEIASVGYDWPHLDIVMFYSLDYKDTNFLQGYRRGVRGKREKPLLVYVYFYEGRNVERDVIDIIEGKMKIANQSDPTRIVFDLLKRRHPDLKVSDVPKPQKEYKKNRALGIANMK